HARETNFVSDPLTIVALLVTCSQSNLAASDAARMHAGLPGEGGARARTCNPLPGGFGHQPLGTRWTQGQAGTGKTRLTKAATSQEAWPEAEPRTTTRPLGENRGGTPIDVRLPYRGRGRARKARQITALRLSAFCFRFFFFFSFFPVRSSVRHCRA